MAAKNDGMTVQQLREGLIGKQCYNSLLEATVTPMTVEIDAGVVVISSLCWPSGLWEVKMLLQDFLATSKPLTVEGDRKIGAEGSELRLQKSKNGPSLWNVVVPEEAQEDAPLGYRHPVATFKVYPNPLIRCLKPQFPSHYTPVPVTQDWLDLTEEFPWPAVVQTPSPTTDEPDESTSTSKPEADATSDAGAGESTPATEPQA